MITRRGFIGSMFAVPALTVSAGTLPSMEILSDEPRKRLLDDCRTCEEVVIPTDGGAHRGVKLPRLTRSIMRVVEAHMRADLRVTRVVGPWDAKIGTNWGSGYFTQQPFAIIEGVQLRRMTHSEPGGPYAFDRLMIEDVGKRLAEQIKRHNLSRFGKIVMPNGMMDMAAVSTPRLFMRAVALYDIARDDVKLRLDILGGPA